MNLALMVKRVLLKRKESGGLEAIYKGDAVVNLSFATTGLIISWGEGDSFEIDFDDMHMLQNLTNGQQMKIEKERYLSSRPPQPLAPKD